MPTYEFRCPDGTIIERIFKMSEAPQTIPNPNGEGEAVRIISGGAALLFKGSGFYITDYRDAAYKDKAKADSDAAGGGNQAKDGKEAKPAGDAAPAAAKESNSSDAKSSESKSSGSGASESKSSKAEPAKASPPAAPPTSRKAEKAEGKAKSPKKD